MRNQWFHAKFQQSLNKRLNEALGDKSSVGIAQHIKIMIEYFCFHPLCPPILSNKVIITNAPSFGNPELFQVDSDEEEEEDLEKIEWEADEQIVAVKIHNEKRWLEWEDQKRKVEEEWKWKEVS